MKKNEVKIGGVYVATVGDEFIDVRIEGESHHGGWNATTLATNKKVRIKSAQRLRAPAGATAGGAKTRAGRTSDTPVNASTPAKAKAENASAKAVTSPKPKRLGALDAAAQVLKSAGNPMRSRELIAAMAEQGLWTSPAGRTPHATLYAAILREIKSAAGKGKSSRFRKVDRGLFAFSAAAES